MNEVDVVLWLVEPTTFIGAGERHIIDQLKRVKTPVILVINKIDMVKKEDLLPAIDTYRKEYDFADIVPVSARSGDNTDELVKVILNIFLTVLSSMMRTRSQISLSARLWRS